MNGDHGFSNGMGGEKEFVEERVAFIAHSERVDRFIPRISVSKTFDRIGRAKVEKTFRPFQTDDITRVLDYDQATDPPPDGTMMHGEESKEGMAFPNRHFCLRGGFLFYFDLSDVNGTSQSHYYTYSGSPIGVIPLDKSVIEFPPGGRRVFREHAQSNARNGYELVILHQSQDEATRPPAFVVAETLGLREKWASALRARTSIDQPTVLRAAVYNADASLYTKPHELLKQAELKKKEAAEAAEAAKPLGSSGGGSSKQQQQQQQQQNASNNKKDSGKKPPKKSKRTSVSSGKDKSGGDSQENIVQEAVHEFGKHTFLEKNWIDTFYENHNDFDAQQRVRQLEQWQEAIKKGLKGAVLEQYEYFVEASGEMTTMGREVVALKTLVETQVETIKEMKEIDFSSALVDPHADEGSEQEGDMFDPARIRKARRRNSAAQNNFGDDGSDVSSVSSFGGGGGGREGRDGGDGSGRKDRTTANGGAGDGGPTTKPKFRDPANQEGAIELPTWFDDVTEEILAFVKESRYTDATDLWAKAKQEIADLMRQHEQPTDNLLTKKQYVQLQALIKHLDEMAEITSSRLVESLRRKNEALKQASKRERSDPQAQMAPSVSPCCLDDDGVPLRLLVKLGKTQEAATAYSARRSLLLLERYVRSKKNVQFGKREQLRNVPRLLSYFVCASP
jgi:hypothetical protein